MAAGVSHASNIRRRESARVVCVEVSQRRTQYVLAMQAEIVCMQIVSNVAYILQGIMLYTDCKAQIVLYRL